MGRGMLISAVNALTCYMDLIACVHAVFSCMWGFDRFARSLGFGRSKDTCVLPVEGVACVHAM